MKNTRPYKKVVLSLAFSLLATAIVVLGGAWLIRVLMPFVIGWILSCIANPIVCWLDKKLKIKKKLGSAITIVFVLVIVIGLLYLIFSWLFQEMGKWVLSLPALYKNVSSEWKELVEVLPEGIRSVGETLASSIGKTIGNLITKFGEPTVSVAKQIPTAIIGAFVTILSAYFFVADRETISKWAEKVIPESIYKRLFMALDIFKHAVGGYFIAQFKIMAVVCAILLIGLGLLKVKYVLLLSILIGFLDFLPFFGTGTAFIPWCIYTVLTGDYIRALFLTIIYVVSQVVRQLIQPKLVGDEVGLKPLPTLLLIYIGYKMGGFLWMILAVPLGMILIEMYRKGAFDYIFDDVKILLEGIKKLKEK